MTDITTPEALYAVSEWRHTRWTEPHTAVPTDVFVRPLGGTGTNPLMATCSTCGEVLLPATFRPDRPSDLAAEVERWKGEADAAASDAIAQQAQVAALRAGIEREIRHMLDVPADVRRDREGIAANFRALLDGREVDQ